MTWMRIPRSLSSLRCLPRQTSSPHQCTSAARHSQNTAIEMEALAGGVNLQVRMHTRTHLQRTASIVSGKTTPGAIYSGSLTPSLHSRSECKKAMGCDSRRTAARQMQDGHSEASLSRHHHQDTTRAGGIDIDSSSVAHLDQHVLPQHRIRTSSLTSLQSIPSQTGFLVRRYYTMASETPPLLLSYKSTSEWPFLPSSSTNNPLRMAILDSSFNPPSKAHYAIATYTPDAFDAHLLLLSSKNVDKVPGPGDSAFEDRIAMMEIMAKHMQAESPGKFTNIAVGSLAAATFAEKAPIIQAYLQASPAHKPNQQYTLIFFIGFDTVTRLFMPKYYGDSEENMHKVLEKFFIHDNCKVICAKRPVENVAQKDVEGQKEDSFFARPEVQKYVNIDKLQLVDVHGTVGISSTKIRNAFKQLASSNLDDSEKELKSLILEDILEYCKEKGLYNR